MINKNKVSEQAANQKKKQYKKLMRQYNKKLRQISKDVCPWDYGNLLDYMLTSFNFMKDYYDLGYNVHCLEPSSPDIPTLDDVPLLTRSEMLDKILKAYASFETTENKYFQVSDTGVETLLPDLAENQKAYLKEQTMYWNEFWDNIKQYLQYIWD